MDKSVRRLALTGASGFIGNHVLNQALEAGFEVHSFGRKPVPGAVHHYWDALVDTPGTGLVFDAVVHCAAAATDWGDDEMITAINTQGTERALRIDPQARFIHMSTASVYSHRGDGYNLSENDAKTSGFLNAYTSSKYQAETIARSDNRANGVFILRPHAVYGPGDTTLLPRVEAGIHFSRLILPRGGSSLMSLTRVESLVQVVLDIINLDPSHDGGVYNVCDGTPVRLCDALVRIMVRRDMRLKIASVPSGLLWHIGAVLEKVYKACNSSSPPPVSRYLVSQLGYAETLDVSRIESLLGRKMPDAMFDDARHW